MQAATTAAAGRSVLSLLSRGGRRSRASAYFASAAASSQHIRSYDKQYVNGEWIDSTSRRRQEVFDSNTGRPVATVPRGTEADALKAVAAARSAQEGWRRTDPRTRQDRVEAFLDAYGTPARLDEVADRLVTELGCTPSDAKGAFHARSMVAQGRTLLRLLRANDDREFEWERAAGRATVVREPVGVVGAITPWNYPVYQMALKVVPALLAGCAVVLKPSEVTPLVAYSVCEAIDEAGCFPPGVFNMIVGEGPECGEILARHPDVDLVSFTGSTRAGHILTRAASATMKPVRTELGGKSAAVLLDDADYDACVPAFVGQLMENSGQSCNALSRMLVPRGDYEAVVDLCAEEMNKVVVGGPDDPHSTMGPLASKAQYDRVLSFVRKGLEEGARLVCGGLPDDDDPSRLDDDGGGGRGGGGYFVKPTLFADVTNDMTIAREEIFGPVLCVIPYDSEEDAVRIANDTPYGLNNAVASRDPKRALEVASRLESGMVMVNKTDLDIRAPFGGYKSSGNAREGGLFGLDEFLVTKAINIPLEEYRSIMYSSNSNSN